MTLDIVATPHSQWQHLKPALEVLGWTETQSNPEQWQSNLPTGERDPNRTYLLLHTRPELALARAVADGETLDQAFAAWDAATDRLLNFYQKNRQGAALVDATAASAAPQTLISWLGENHSAFTGQTAPVSLESVQAPGPSNPILLLIAAQFLAGVPDLELKLGRLEAMSVPLNDDGYVAPAIDLNAVLEDVQQAQSTHSALQSRAAELEQKTQEAKASVQSENSSREDQLQLLELQLHQVQEEMEEAEEEKTKLKQQLQSLEEDTSTEQELKRVQQKLSLTEETLGKDLEDARAENELLILQLHQVQEELEEQYLKQEELNEVLERKRKELEAQLEDIKHHLALTQNDVQASHAKAQQLETELAAKRTLIDQQEGEITDKNRKLQKLSASKKAASQKVTELQRAVKAAEHQQRILSGELERLQKSVSWRLSSPVRAITSVIKVAHRPSRRQKSLVEQAKLIEDSNLFDAGWYLDKYPDVASEPLPPAQHYLAYGAGEGRDPSEQFSTKWYLSKNKDVAQSGMNPLLHYLLYGKEEGRKPGPNAKA